VRTLLGKHLTRQFQDEDLSQVLTELSEFSGVTFYYSPGVLQRVPEKYRRVTLTLDGATVEDTLENISGATGLRFEPSDRGVEVSAGSAAKP